jgi:hypothetical protein
MLARAAPEVGQQTLSADRDSLFNNSQLTSTSGGRSGTRMEPFSIIQFKNCYFIKSWKQKMYYFLPVDVYRCKKYSLTLKDSLKLLVTEN